MLVSKGNILFSCHKMYWVYGACPKFLDKLALNGWCGQSHVGCLYISGNFLEPILNWVILGGQVNKKKSAWKEFEYMTTKLAGEYASHYYITASSVSSNPF